jgi:hypothetical protein
MLSFLEFLALDEDTVPANNIGDGNVDGYDPRMALRKMLRRKTWKRRKAIKKETDAKITESIAQYQQIKEELYGNH